ncbi:hypothetical protein [Cellulomonas cellasea]|uniref:Uncharacterized protein n=2 Tax=Cellulomonas cellasea TaxID=43670 RepID=A0A0A0B998_9CELL|nr:hypothetical protein [Cellulomonas cellasea]KGM03425.1 hypothetical protein Q760_04105 [Cellulomonas cellasea DSM 20118]GEA90258.1 hypothetical protein CCE01nite_42070 [Cellulomonas cellasea]
MRHASASVEDGTSEGSGVEPSVHGPVISLHHPGTRESFRAWLTAFARELTRTGCQGRVLASPQVDTPDELRPVRARCRPAAFLAYSMTVPPDLRGAPAGTPERWGVDPAVTERMCRDLAAWARVPGDQVILTQGTSRVAYQRLGLADQLAWPLVHGFVAGVTEVTEAPPVLRDVSMPGTPRTVPTRTP